MCFMWYVCSMYANLHCGSAHVCAGECVCVVNACGGLKLVRGIFLNCCLLLLQRKDLLPSQLGSLASLPMGAVPSLHSLIMKNAGRHHTLPTFTLLVTFIASFWFPKPSSLSLKSLYLNFSTHSCF